MANGKYLKSGRGTPKVGRDLMTTGKCGSQGEQ